MVGIDGWAMASVHGVGGALTHGILHSAHGLIQRCIVTISGVISVLLSFGLSPAWFCSAGRFLGVDFGVSRGVEIPDMEVDSPAIMNEFFGVYEYLNKYICSSSRDIRFATAERDAKLGMYRT
jgi:hypothetical protein